MQSKYKHTWEEAVEWLRQQPDKQDLVQHCYYDDPLEVAAERFYKSEEWNAIKHLLGDSLKGRVLDIGAGRGISSFAFVKSGCEVVALEPDPSSLVGSCAIKTLFSNANMPIDVVQNYGEKLPFENESFDIVYGRAILHHARNLHQLCSEAARVLKPGGIFLITREHVLSKKEDLQVFLDAHPLHSLYGGENAYLLKEYITAIELAGLKLKRSIGPYESPINYAPLTRSELYSKLTSRVNQKKLRGLLSVKFIMNLMVKYLSHRSQTPGRHFSFLAIKL